MRTGLLICIDGGDGAGKTSQAQRLLTWLVDQGIPTILSREPGGTPLGEKVRVSLLETRGDGLTAEAELFLFLAARAEHVQKVIRPALERGVVVVLDRFSPSTYAYQGEGLGMNLEFVSSADEWATGGLQPDLTIVLDVAPEVGLARLVGADRIESRDLEFHARVREGFLAYARAHSDCGVVDASAGADQVWEAVREHVAALLDRRAEAAEPQGAVDAGDAAP